MLTARFADQSVSGVEKKILSYLIGGWLLLAALIPLAVYFLVR